MITEMVRRVALAIWQARENTFEPRLRRMQPDHIDSATGSWALCVEQAVAAIETMRDPTDDMIAAGIAEADICTDGQTICAVCIPEHAWPKMIDAALAVSESTEGNSTPGLTPND